LKGGQMLQQFFTTCINFPISSKDMGCKRQRGLENRSKLKFINAFQ